MDETSLLIRNFEYDGQGPSKSLYCNVIFCSYEVLLHGEMRYQEGGIKGEGNKVNIHQLMPCLYEAALLIGGLQWVGQENLR